MVLFIFGAVGFGLLLYLIMKKKKSTVFALILGLTYGYVLMAAVLPLVTNIPAILNARADHSALRASGQVAQQAQSGANQLLADPVITAEHPDFELL